MQIKTRPSSGSPFNHKQQVSGIDYNEHRKFLLEVGNTIAGSQAIGKDDAYLYVYRVSHPSAPNQTVYLDGSVYQVWTDGPNAFVTIDGSTCEVMVLADMSGCMEYLNSLYHLCHTERRKVAMYGSQRLQNSSTAYSAPSGALGHLIKEYDKLIDQVKQEYFFQKSRHAATETMPDSF